MLCVIFAMALGRIVSVEELCHAVFNLDEIFHMIMRPFFKIRIADDEKRAH